jgi:hypothetical protein
MRKMKYSSLFGILALVLVLVLYLPFYVSAQLPIYFAWLAGVSLTAFIFYGLDKSLSKIQRFTVRVPELILNLLALGYVPHPGGEHAAPRGVDLPDLDRGPLTCQGQALQHALPGAVSGQRGALARSGWTKAP